MSRRDPLEHVDDAALLQALADMDAGDTAKTAAARIGAPPGAILDLWVEMESARRKEAAR